MEKIVKFDVGNISVSNDIDSDDFTILEIDIASTVPNSHKLVFTKDSLESCGKTFFLKPIIGKYDKYMRDVEAHEQDEDTFGGFFDMDSIQVVDKEDGSHLMAKGFLWKNYCTGIVDMMNRRQDIAVSMEILLKDYDEDTGLVKKFVGKGCTLLGSSVRPSIPTSHAKLVTFSDMKDAFDKEVGDFGRLKKLSEKYTMSESHPIDASAKAIYDGEWDGEKAKADLIKESNFTTLAPKVCLLLEDGWKNKEVTKLKYPVMTLEKGKWVYSRRGLASALAYAKKEKEDDVVSKIEAIYKKLNLDEKGEMAEMAEIEGRKAWGEVIHQVEDHEGKGVYVESVEKDHIIFKKDNKRFVVKADIKVGEDDKTVHAEIHWDTMKEDADQKEFEAKEDDKEEEKKEEEEEDKKEEEEDKKEEMSANVNVDAAAVAEYLAREAKYNEVLAKDFIEGGTADLSDDECEKKFGECMKDMACLSDAIKDQPCMSADKFNECMCGLAKLARMTQDIGSVYMQKTAELRKFKTDTEKAERLSDVEKIMGEAGCFADDEKEEYRKKAEDMKSADMAALTNEIKAKAFEKAKEEDHKESDSKKFSETKHAQLWTAVGGDKAHKGIWD